MQQRLLVLDRDFGELQVLSGQLTVANLARLGLLNHAVTVVPEGRN